MSNRAARNDPGYGLTPLLYEFDQPHGNPAFQRGEIDELAGYFRRDAGATILKEILQRSSQLAAEDPEKAVSLDVHLVLGQRDLSRLLTL